MQWQKQLQTEAFTGTIETGDKDLDITNNSSGSGTQWNLVAQPLPFIFSTQQCC